MTVPTRVQAASVPPFHLNKVVERWNGTQSRRNTVERLAESPEIARLCAVPRAGGTRWNARNAERAGVPPHFRAVRPNPHSVTAASSADQAARPIQAIEP